MNITDYTYLLNKPDAANDKQTMALEKIVHEFPYFQSARALRLKGLYNQNSFQYNYALKVTAAYSTDRSVLFDFITSDTFTAIHKGLYQEKLAELYNIDVSGSEIISKHTEAAAAEKVEQSILTSIKESVTPFVEQEPEEATILPVANAEEIHPQKATPIAATASSLDIPILEISGKTIEFVPATTPEDKLDIGKPLAFSTGEKHSFREWLQLSRMEPIDRIESTRSHEEIFSGERLKNNELIDRFIEASPKIASVKDFKPTETPIEPEKEDNSALMTETLARVYLEQKKYQKAIQAYEILILKYPEKSIFFADRISEIKNLQQNT